MFSLNITIYEDTYKLTDIPKRNNTQTAIQFIEQYKLWKYVNK